MRKFLFYISAAVFIMACSKDETAQPETTQWRSLSINLGKPMTKTVIDGTSSGNVIPVWWSAGDIINVNGQKSAEFDGSGHVMNAEFKINNIHAPYKMIYPHHAYRGENTDGTVTVEVPATQKYTQNSFESGAMIMYGYSETESIDCRYACGAIKIGLKGDEAEIVKSISICSLSEEGIIAGDFTIDPLAGLITPKENGSQIITVELPDGGLALSDNSTYIIATIPAGSYPDGFEIKMLDQDKRVMRRLWLKHSADAEAGIRIIPGKITSFDNQTFATDSREICSAEDWEEFAQACNKGGDDWKDLWLSKKHSVIIGSDFSAECLTSVENLAEEVTIDGNGHTITLTKATGPLFHTIKGTVKDLTLAGEMKATDPNSRGASAFCSLLAGGNISGCINSMSIGIDASHKSKAVKAAAFAAEMSGGSISGCTNKGNIDIITGLESSKEVMAGGFAAIVRNLTSKAYLTDCTNEADIAISLERAANGTSRPNKAGYGGIVGVILGGNSENFLSVSGCINNGNVSVSFANDPSNAANFSLSGAGGIVGINTAFNNDGNFPTTPSGHYMQMTGCTNNGNIFNGLASKASSSLLDDVCAGGLAGILIGTSGSHIPIDGCKNNGTVRTYEGTAFKRATYVNVCGGLCGIGGWLDFDMCDVVSKQIGTVKGRTYSVSAGIGLAIRSFTMTGCRFNAEIQAIRCTNFTEGSHSLAFCATTTSKSGNIDAKYGLDLSGSEISGCSFCGKLTTNSVTASPDSTSPVSTDTVEFTKDTYSGYIISKTSGTTDVILKDNKYWEGAQ